MISQTSDISRALEVEIPLVLNAHVDRCASSCTNRCSCSLVQNEAVLYGNFHDPKVFKALWYQCA